MTRSFKALETGLSSVPIPGLSAIIYILEEMFKFVTEIQVRQNESEQVANLCVAILQAIADNTQDSNKLSPQFRNFVDDTIKVIHRTRDDFRQWRAYNRTLAVLHNFEMLTILQKRRGELEACARKLLLNKVDKPQWDKQIMEGQQLDAKALKVLEQKREQQRATIKELQEIFLKPMAQSTSSQTLQTIPPEVTQAKKKLFELRAKPHLEDGVLPEGDLTGECKKTAEKPFHSGNESDMYNGLWLNEHHVHLRRFRAPLRPEEEQATITEYERSLDIWRALGHPNVIKLYGICNFTDANRRESYLPLSQFAKMHLVTPWLENRDCVKYLVKKPNTDRLKLIVEVARGLEYLHSMGIIHGGLQGPNVLIDDSGSALLSDFSICKLPESLYPGGRSFGPMPALRWMPPENHNQSPANFKSDVYSWAMTALQIISGKIPFYQMKALGQVLLAVAMKHVKPVRADYTSSLIDDALWGLFESCWQKEPEKRPNMEAIIESLNEICQARGMKY